MEDMPNITIEINGNITTYFYNGVKKYVHLKDSDGYESWTEYDEKGNETHFKNSNGYESWTEYDTNGNEIHFKGSDGYESFSDDNPKNPKNRPLTEEDIKPFVFEK